MAIDRNKILNELGSVMNQLQNADCGCMGNVFSHPKGGHNGLGNPGGNCMRPLPTCGGCRRGMCPGHGGGCGGEPHNMVAHQGMGGMGGMRMNGMANMGGMGNMCGMGCHCNPTKLYSDTYNYLNKNLMQPAVQEVYNDLSTINPANTMGNNPLAAKMGLNPGQSGGAMPMTMGQSGGAMPMTGPMGGGMGEQIVNMMASNPKQQGMDLARQMMGVSGKGGMGAGGMGAGGMGAGGMGAGGMGAGGMVAETMNAGGMNAGGMSDGRGNMAGEMPMHSNGLEENVKHGHMPGYMGANAPSNMPDLGGDMVAANMGGNMGANMGGNMGANMGGNMHGNPGAPNVAGQEQMIIDAPQSPFGKVGLTATPLMAGQGMNATMQNPTAAYMTTPQTTLPAGNAANPASQMMPGMNPYGQHESGMKKFNEMFPGVIKGANSGNAGGLDFDPMAIALQMNPNNHKAQVMETMKKVMMGGPGANMMGSQGNQQMIAQGQPGQVLQQAPQNQVPANINPGAQQVNQMGQPVQQINGQLVPIQQVAGQSVPIQQVTDQPIPVQQVGGQPVPIQHHNYVGDPIPAPPTNVVGQVIPPQQQQVYNVNVTGQPIQQQVCIDPNTGAPLNQPGQGDQGHIAQQMQQSQSLSPEQEQQQQQQPPMPTEAVTYFNALGQEYTPVSPLLYKTELPDLTPYPHTVMPVVKSMVKNTVSKTALMGSKPMGGTPSRSQLQQVYNMYKGSQSMTDQRYLMRPPVSNSVGRLATNQQYGTNPAVQHRPNPQQLHVGGPGAMGRPMMNMQDPALAGRPANQQINPALAGQPNANQQINPALAGQPNPNQQMNPALAGQLNPNQQMTVPNPAAIETTAGDSAANDANANIPKQLIQANPTGDTIAAPAILDKKYRNGLQDMKHVAYSTASWSFHGAPTPMFYNHKYRSLAHK